MQYNKVEISGVNTNELKTLKESEKLELLKKAHSGDKKAREELINGNLRLVLSVLQKFVSRSDSPDDLFQVGVVGLIKAIDNFDTSLDVKFSTYAVPMIAGELRRFLRDFQPMRVSRSLRDLAYKAMQAKEQLICENQKEPTVGRNTPFKTRGHVAMVGTFGYELDVTRIPQEDRDAIPPQIEEFNKFNKLVRTGDHYRIGNMFEDNTWDAWEFVAKDKSEALFEFVQVLGRPNERSRR